MDRFKNILMVYNPNQQTLDRAVRLALENEARLTVVDVVRELVGEKHLKEPGLKPLDLQALVKKEFDEQLKQFVSSVKHDGLRISTKVLVGHTFLEIIREVIRNKHDLVIMTAEGKDGLRERLFGSTSMHLMRECPCPVWVMKPTRRKRIERILAAVDPDPRDKTKTLLNETILELAVSLAEMETADLHVVHAWRLYGESSMKNSNWLQTPKVSLYLKQEKAKQEKLLNSLVSKYPLENVKVHLVKGEAYDVIRRVVKKEKTDLLVMGTVCRTGIAGFLIGNTAENVLNGVDCSVLTVKPEGFSSPITAYA
jgi:nucleotide-binding universal stress UspA family protein